MAKELHLKSSCLFLCLILAILTAPSHCFAAGKRHALLVGFSEYTPHPYKDSFGPLSKTRADAQGMAKLLKEYGFIVTTLTDEDVKTKKDFDGQLNKFLGEIESEDDVLFFYSGHGISLSGANWLIPVSPIFTQDLFSPKSIADLAMSAQAILNDISEIGPNNLIFILDSCRNPGDESNGQNIEVASGDMADRTFIAYASQPGKMSHSIIDEEYSYFTGALIEHLRKHKGQNIKKVMEKVIDTVKSRSQNFLDNNRADMPVSAQQHFPQIPHGGGSYTGKFCLGICQSRLNLDYFGQFIEIPAGRFYLGGRQAISADEGGGSQKTIRKRFFMMQEEVTLGLWQRCVNAGKCDKPGKSDPDETDSDPVTQVSWNQIQQQFIPWYRQNVSGNARLPTEIEWEYIAQLWKKGRAPESFKDIHNSLFALPMEWTSDCWQPNHSSKSSNASTSSGSCKQFVIRGKQRDTSPETNRGRMPKYFQGSRLGFRLVTDTPPSRRNKQGLLTRN